MPGTISQYQVVIPGQTITASLWNGMENNIINNGLVWSGIDDYSVNDAQMQVQTDPYPASTTSRPTSAQGELERLRFILAQITGKTYWYQDPDQSMATAKTNFDAHTHSGAANQGPQIAAAGLASDSVTTAKILDSNVTTAKIADLNVTDAKIASLATSKLTGTISTAQIASAAVDENKLAASVAGSGLAGGAGTALSVNVDASTIEINSDTLRVKDAGVTEAKLATAVVNKLGQNIGIVALAIGTVSYTGQGRLKGVGVTGGTANVTIVVDGITLFNGSISTNNAALWTYSSLTSGATGTLDSINVFFKTSFSVAQNSGAGTVTTAYERTA